MSEKKPPNQRVSAIPPFGLRMLPDLRAKIEAAAEQNRRSLNAEIVARLESSLLRDQRALEAEDPSYVRGRRMIPDDLAFGLEDALKQILAVTDFMKKFKIKRDEAGNIVEVSPADRDGADGRVSELYRSANKRLLDL